MASLSERFLEAMARGADRGAPSSVRGAMERYGWSTRDLAVQLGVSERTARRYAQQNRITARSGADREARNEQFRQRVREAASGRQRARMERRGVTNMTASGTYFVSKRTYRTSPGLPVRTLPGNKIPASAMRDYFAALDAGDPAAADAILNGALGGAYEAPTTFVDAEAVGFTI